MSARYIIAFLVAGFTFVALAAKDDLLGYFIPSSAKTQPVVELKIGEQLVMLEPTPPPKDGKFMKVPVVPMGADGHLDFSRETMVEINTSDFGQSFKILHASDISNLSTIFEICQSDIRTTCGKGPCLENENCSFNRLNCLRRNKDHLLDSCKEQFGYLSQNVKIKNNPGKFKTR